jgi:hypothetical protein
MTIFIGGIVMNIYLEIFGYVGTALVLLSMMMTSVVKLRLFNIVDSIISMIYSILCGAWPVVFLNFGLIIINVYQLLRLGRTKVMFAHVPVAGDDKSLAYFMMHHRADIEKFFPGYSFTPDAGDEVHLVCAGAEIVGVLIGQRIGDTLQVKLDYATEKYRDTSVATFLYGCLKENGIARLKADKSAPEHNRYLRKMGFRTKEGVEVKEL